LTSDQAPKGHVEDTFAAPLAPTVNPTQIENLDAKDIQDIIETLQKGLKPEYRQALHDFYILGWSHEQISEKRGWPKGSVGVYLHRGLEAMRKQRLKYPQLTKEAMQYILKMLL
jgi:DNA-directed RNA polymerase specialized sigma24 family protein